MATRKYEQRLRATTAEDTRRRILDAVYERLRAAPAQPLNVDEVARAAGVARSTVYLIFGSRAGLFDAVGEDLLRQSGWERLLRAVEDPDAREHLRGAMRGSAEMFAVHRDVRRVLFSMALLDAAAVGDTVQQMDGNRAGGVAYLARRLAEQDQLRPDVTVEHATSVLWLLTSFDSFDQLYNGRAMSVDEVADTLISTAERALCR